VARSLVAGVDSSTQSVKVTIRDLESGEQVSQARASHPDGTEVDPEVWVGALDDALAEAASQAGVGAVAKLVGVGVAAQQHGMVLLDEDDRVVRPALLWNDTRSAAAADDLVRELGGAEVWAESTGSLPVAAFTVSKVRWVAQHEPEAIKRAVRVMLPHDFLTRRLSGNAVFATDRGDASGTGYFSPATGEYLSDFLVAAAGKALETPRVAQPNEVVGEVAVGANFAASAGLAAGAKLSAGTGDNMGAALGLGLNVGDVVVSLGTSGTAFGVSATPTADPTGVVAGFADATGNFLPLVCTLNAARTMTAGAQLLGVDLAGLSDLALRAESGAGGLVLLPYLDGERTPNLPDARGSLHGITRENFTKENLARAVVEGMLCGLADAVDALSAQGLQVNRVLLIGGAASSPAVQQIAATIFSASIVVPVADEYVAVGAARQAAWAVLGGGAPPAWPATPAPASAAASPPAQTAQAPVLPANPNPQVRANYASARNALHP